MSFYLQVVKKENIIMSRSLDSPETSRKIEDSRYDSADVSWAHLVWDDDMYCPRCCQSIRSTETRSTTYEPAKHFVNSAIDQNVITLQQKTRFSVQICQKLAQTHYANFLFHEYTVNTLQQE